MWRFLEGPFLADFSLMELYLKQDASPMAASQNSIDGLRPKGDSHDSGSGPSKLRVSVHLTELGL